MNPYGHRPITFNGVQLPAEMMGISILECIVSMPESVANWLWRLPICIGLEKNSNSFVACNASVFARDAMIEYRSKILAGIAERFPLYHTEEVYGKWMEGLNQIIDLSHQTAISRWIAPLSPDEPVQTSEEAEKFLEGLKKLRSKISEEGSAG
jgi:hypothetical protein